MPGQPVPPPVRPPQRLACPARAGGRIAGLAGVRGAASGPPPPPLAGPDLQAPAPSVPALIVTITKYGSSANFVIVVTQGGGVRVCAGGRSRRGRTSGVQTARRHRPASWQHAPEPGHRDHALSPITKFAQEPEISARATDAAATASPGHRCGSPGPSNGNDVPPMRIFYARERRGFGGPLLAGAEQPAPPAWSPRTGHKLHKVQLRIRRPGPRAHQCPGRARQDPTAGTTPGLAPAQAAPRKPPRAGASVGIASRRG